ncbi:MAG: DNA damage-inducible protein D [Chloroflexi bacterium]|nr:DNA damage-inducible protein D [Chloroflexota bacterium]
MKKLEDIKHIYTNGSEYWFGRELQSVLGYATWDSFQPAITRAMKSCDTFGSAVDHHFHHTTNMIALGKGATRDIGDTVLSRYACYLVAMNGDASKPEIAGAQAYFAIQTRRQELFDQLSEVEKRAALRDRVKDANKHLNDAAQGTGVEDFGLFHDAGYRGLYGGLSRRQIMQKKGIRDNESLLDCISRMELAENEFRITQTEAKLVREKIQGDLPARQTHFRVANKIRETINEIGGTVPENLPREPSIKKLKSKIPPKELPPTTIGGNK